MVRAESNKIYVKYKHLFKTSLVFFNVFLSGFWLDFQMSNPSSTDLPKSPEKSVYGR